MSTGNTARIGAAVLALSCGVAGGVCGARELIRATDFTASTFVTHFKLFALDAFTAGWRIAESLLTQVVVLAGTTDTTGVSSSDTEVLLFLAFEGVALVLGSTVLFLWVARALAHFLALPVTAEHVDFTGGLSVTLFAQGFSAGFLDANAAVFRIGGQPTDLVVFTVGVGGSAA